MFSLHICSFLACDKEYVSNKALKHLMTKSKTVYLIGQKLIAIVIYEGENYKVRGTHFKHNML